MLYALIVMSDYTPDYERALKPSGQWVMIMTLLLNATNTSMFTISLVDHKLDLSLMSFVVLIGYRLWNIRGQILDSKLEGNDMLGNFFRVVVESGILQSTLRFLHGPQAYARL